MSATDRIAPDLLETIVAATRRIVEVRSTQRPRSALERAAGAATPRADRFREALARPGSLNVIAECKRRSPSRGVLRAAYDPAAIARSYEAAGAVAISVLTEPTFFDGSLDDLHAVRTVVDLPVLRKDFIVSEYQLLEARAAGADAALLIAAALDAGTLAALNRAAGELGLAALVEVHDRAELDRALAAGATIVGVNNRNLRTLAVSLDTSLALVEAMRGCVVAVAESGLRTRTDLLALREAGFDAFLIGEWLMTTPDPGAALRKLLN